MNIVQSCGDNFNFNFNHIVHSCQQSINDVGKAKQPCLLLLYCRLKLFGRVRHIIEYTHDHARVNAIAILFNDRVDKNNLDYLVEQFVLLEYL